MLLIQKWKGLSMMKNGLWRCWDYLFLLNWIWTFTLFIEVTLPQRELEPWLVFWNLFLLKVRPSPSKNNCLICFNESRLKIVKNAFCFILNALFFSRYLNFCLGFLVIQKRQLDEKENFKFKIYGIATWLTNTYDTHITKNLTK